MQEIKVRVPKAYNKKLKIESKKKFGFINVAHLIRELIRNKYFND